jgi:hypothetical protein
MSGVEWEIVASVGVAWTPAEVAQITRAAQAFQAELPTAGGKTYHLVHLNMITVLENRVEITWPQPGDPVPDGD